MRTSRTRAACHYEVLQDKNGSITINLQGRMDASNAGQLIKAVKSRMGNLSPTVLTVNLEKVTYLDDFGALVLVELKNSMHGAQNAFCLTNAPDNVSSVLSTLNFDHLEQRAPLSPKPRPNMFLRLGDAVFQHAMLFVIQNHCEPMIRFRLWKKSVLMPFPSFV
jgi:phospholipid/cholesterol/gamma-HCH transport system permease protein